MQEHDTDAIVATHTGIKWRRHLPGGKLFVNAGVLGRPENDGTTNVWYTVLEADTAHKPVGTPDPRASARANSAIPTRALSPSPPHTNGQSEITVTFVPVEYDHECLAREMASEGLPSEFRETILTGWWTTCLEILPAKERKCGRF